jgi:plastocyanin
MPIGSPNAGYRLFNTGDVLTAAQVQFNLQNQTIMYFATAAARDAALTVGTLQEGMFAYLADTKALTFYNGAAWEGIFNYPTLTSPFETNTITAGPATGTVNLDVATSAVLIYTSNASADWILNVRGNVSTTLNSLMTTGEQISVVFESPIGATAYEPTALQIDGVGQTVKWLGGSAPTGNINSTDVYIYTIRKTGSAAYTVLASQSKFA